MASPKVAIASAVNIIKEKFPSVEADYLKYLEDVVKTNHSDFESSAEVFDAIGDFLLEIDSSVSESELRALCDRIYELFPRNDSNCLRLLDAPVTITELISRETSDHLSREQWKNNSLPQRNSYKNIIGKSSLKDKSTDVKKKASLTPPDMETQSATVCQQIKKKHSNDDDTANLGVIHIPTFDVSFGKNQLISEASLTLTVGRRYGFVGRNGLGKTTLLKLLASGDLKFLGKFSIMHVEQEVVGDDTIATNSVLNAHKQRFSLMNELSRLTKDKSSSELNHERVAAIYAELSNMGADSFMSQVCIIMCGLGFSLDMQKMKTREFSGGWRMRLALAGALFAKPDLLLLDEPTNMLDLRAVIWLSEYLQTWPGTLITVSHDQNFLNETSTDIIHLRSRKLEVYKGNYDMFKITSEEKRVNLQKQYDAQQLLRQHAQVFIDKFRYSAARASLVQSKIKQLEKLPHIEPIEAEPKVVFRFPECVELSGSVLYLDEVSFHYESSKPLFSNVNISTEISSRICLVGENGSGKSTLLKILLGELSPVSGVRHAHGSLRIGYFSQHHVDQLDVRCSSLEFLSTKYPGQPAEFYRAQLGAFNLSGDIVLKPISTLSGGQKSRVAFANIAMKRPNFLILDEPTNHLDIQTIDALSDALRKFNGGVILVSHDERLIESVCNEIWLCNKEAKRVEKISGGLLQYRKRIQQEMRQTGKIVLSKGLQSS